MPTTRAVPSSSSSFPDARPRVIVFDLDGTLWDPEMYQLHGGAPFSADPKNPCIMIDRSGTPVELLGETRTLLSRLAFSAEWQGKEAEAGEGVPKTGENVRQTYLAVSSTCDYPEWARDLLQKYKIPKGSSGETVPMKQVFTSTHIYYANKAQHHEKILQDIHEIDPSVSRASQMLFFDNQRNNVKDVSSFGAPSCYAPRGMQKGVFEEGLEIWRRYQSSKM